MRVKLNIMKNNDIFCMLDCLKRGRNVLIADEEVEGYFMKEEKCGR